MGIKVKAVERNVSFSKDAKDAKWEYVMKPELYGQLDVDKVVKQAALVSGLSEGLLRAALYAYGNVVIAWATEGHSIPIPGLGTMRFGLRSTAVDDVKKVKTNLITSRRVIYTPSVEIKKALAETSVSITCYDRNGDLVKTVSSADKDDVEDPEGDNSGAGTGSEGGSSSTGGSGSSSTGGSGSSSTGGSGSSSTGGSGSSSTGDDDNHDSFD